MAQPKSPSEKIPVTSSAPAEQMPLFYRKIAVLEASRCAGKSLKTNIGFDFARATNVVMLNAAEFEQAARVYPIVFASSPNPAALALLGVREAENLFVDANGDWRPNTYIPAYVRRYPFIFHRTEDGQQFTLCIDEASGALEDGAERPLFADGAPTISPRARSSSVPPISATMTRRGNSSRSSRRTSFWCRIRRRSSLRRGRRCHSPASSSSIGQNSRRFRASSSVIGESAGGSASSMRISSRLAVLTI